MKKLISYFPHLFIVATLTLAGACNSAQTHDDTDRTKSENGKSDPNTPDTSMTDTTRLAKSGASTNNSAEKMDTGFVSKNIMDNMMEVQLAKMGRDKGTNKQLTKIANQIITDHTQMLNELKTVAAKKKVTVPANGPMDMPVMQSLSNAKGKNFDQAWKDEMLKMHEAKIEELQNAINQITDAEIKAVASNALPKVKLHRDMLAGLSTQ
jgi:putative membrane protein